MKQQAIQAHIDNGFCAKFSKKKIGGVLEIPENVLLKRDAKQYLYEIDDDGLTVYLHGVKQKNIKMPQYAIRPFCMMDIICSMSNMGMSPLLLLVFDENGQEIKSTDDILTTKRAVELLDKPKTKKQQSLENELFDGLEHFITEGCPDQITEEISEGFEIIATNYLSSDIDE